MSLKVKHTPGPWKFGELSEKIMQDCAPKRPTFIAQVLDLPSEEEKAANARLLAAAPDLLEETKKTLAWLKHLQPQIRARMPTSVALGFDQAIKTYTALIEKAEGGKNG